MTSFMRDLILILFFVNFLKYLLKSENIYNIESLHRFIQNFMPYKIICRLL